jgi:hypothetical protein
MNYKEMLDKFEYLDKQMAYLENEVKYLRERLAKVEGSYWFNQPKPPMFTPGTLPQPTFWPQNFWYSTTETTTNPQDGFQ